jgi:type II secretory pathway pseudopilin PulG
MPIGRNLALQNSGFTYIGLMIMIAISGIALAGVGIVWHQDAQREREKELLFIGDAYRQAIASYYTSTPEQIKQLPKTLEALILDNRFPSIKRHIRKLYLDPITGLDDWGLVMQGEGIAGVYSKSDKAPLKKSGFSLENESFKDAKEYSGWKFIFTPSS